MSKPPTTKKKTFGSNLNNLTKAPVAVQSTSRYGSSRLLSLGKVGPAKGLNKGGPAAPIPLNTPSLRKESGGQDTTVVLVPATPGWGKTEEPAAPPAPETQDVAEIEQPRQSQPKMAPWAKPGGLAKSSWAGGATSANVDDEPTAGSSPILGPALGGTKNMKWGDLDSDDDDDEDDALRVNSYVGGGGGMMEQASSHDGPPMTRDQTSSNQHTRSPYNSNHHGQNFSHYGMQNGQIDGQRFEPPQREFWPKNNEIDEPSPSHTDAFPLRTIDVVLEGGESQSEYMMRTARERKEKRMQEEEEAEKIRKAKAHAKQREIEEKMALRETLVSESPSEEDSDRLMWRRSPLPPQPHAQENNRPISQHQTSNSMAIPQVLRPSRPSQPSPTASPQMAPQPPPKVLPPASNIDGVYSNLFAGISAPVMPDENTMMGQPVPRMADAVVNLEEMAPRAAAHLSGRHLYDPKNDCFVEHHQRKSSDASDGPPPKSVTTKKASKNNRPLGAPTSATADISNSQTSLWKREGEVQSPKQPKDSRKKDEKADLRKKREDRDEDSKAGRALERATRPPRTQGKLYRYNEAGEIEDVDRPEEAKERAEKRRLRLEEEKVGKTSTEEKRVPTKQKGVRADDSTKLSDRKERKGKKGRPEQEKFASETSENTSNKTSGQSGRKKGEKDDKAEESPPPQPKRTIPPPPPEAWGVGKNPLVPTAPPQEVVVVPEQDKSSNEEAAVVDQPKHSRKGRGSKAVGPSNKPKNPNPEPPIKQDESSNAVFDENTQEGDIPFTTFNHFSGNDLWQGESSMAPLSLTFQRPSPFDMTRSSISQTANANPSTWGAVGGLAPIAKLSGGLYNFNISNYNNNGDSPHNEDAAEWNSSSPQTHDNGNPLWDNEVLVGLGNFDMEQPIPLPDSELNPSAPAVDSFGRIIDMPPADATPSQNSSKQRNNHKNPQRNKHYKNSKGPKGSSDAGAKEEGSHEIKPAGGKGKGKGKHGNKKNTHQNSNNGQVAVDTTSQPTENSNASPPTTQNKHQRGRGKGRGGHKAVATEGGKGESKKQPEAAVAPTPKPPVEAGATTSSRRRGKGSKK